MTTSSRAVLPTAALFLFASLPAPLFAQEKLARWHDSLERAQVAARSSGKPLFVVFRCVR